jgi:hypothetical protein
MAKSKPPCGEIDNLRRYFPPAAIEDHEPIAALYAQNISRVVRLRSGENKRVGVPIVRRDVRAMHEMFEVRLSMFDVNRNYVIRQIKLQTSYIKHP